MKTALQELMQWMEETEFLVNTAFIKKIDECVKKEKEQIKVAFDLGRDEVTSVFIIDGEDYYNKKFNPKETLEQWKAKFTHHCAIKPKTK
jgi:hypothetical protein